MDSCVEVGAPKSDMAIDAAIIPLFHCGSS